MRAKLIRIAAFLSVLRLSVTAQPVSTAADTVNLSLEQAERLFLNNNLQLLAARFNTDASRASVVQAGLWNNPNLSVEQNVYNQYTRRYFDFSSSGNTGVQIQQLILLAGKRDKQIRLAEANAHIAEESFYNLLRSLKYELRTDCFDLYYLRQSLDFYNESIASIQRTVASTEIVYEKRGIVLSELLRLKSLLLSLQKERLDLLAAIDEKEMDLHVLLHDSTLTNRIIIPHFDSAKFGAFHPATLTTSDIVVTALNRRPDFSLANATVSYDETNLALQRATGIPDITLGGLWSRAGSYIPNYYALTLSIDLPVFNRNQGNIEVSANTLEADKRIRDSVRETIQKEVTLALIKAIEVDTTYASFDRQLTGEYKQLVDGMIANYAKRNISIIEFTDFFESYRNSMVQMIDLQNDRTDAFENLNYAAGTDLFSPY